MSSITQTVLLEKPQVVYVDEDYSVKSPAYATIELLTKSLQENGPLVAVGKMGPSAYTASPFKLNEKIENKEVYGWKQNTFKAQATSTEVILLGTKQTPTNGYVFFTMAKDITKNTDSLIRGYKPLDTDAKVYIMSYENFLKRSLVNLHPICPHGQWLYTVSVNSIVDSGDTEKKCKEIGQQIFDQYKAAAKGNSEAGRSAVKRICEAARVLTSDGIVRKLHIESAWDGVGDANWRWQR